MARNGNVLTADLLYSSNNKKNDTHNRTTGTVQTV